MIRIPQVIYDSPPSELPQRMRKYLKAALAAAVRYWHKHFLPQHFMGSAVSKYGYQPRSLKYRQRKQIAKGHQRPLEWSGLTKRIMTRFMYVRGTSRRATGSMATPGWVTLTLKSPRAINLKKELTKTTQVEAGVLGKFIETRMGKKFRERGTRKVVSLNV